MYHYHCIKSNLQNQKDSFYISKNSRIYNQLLAFSPKHQSSDIISQISRNKENNFETKENEDELNISKKIQIKRKCIDNK